MQKCLTDNVVTANEQGCSKLKEQSAGANSPQEVTGLEQSLDSPGCALLVAQHLQKVTNFSVLQKGSCCGLEVLSNPAEEVMMSPTAARARPEAWSSPCL